MTTFLKGASDRLSIPCNVRYRESPVVIQTTARVVQDDNRHLPVKFKAHYRKPTISELEALQPRIKKARMQHDFLALGDIIRQHLVDWEMPGNDGNLVEFRDENLDIAFRHIDYFTAFRESFDELLGGHAGKFTNIPCRTIWRPLDVEDISRLADSTLGQQMSSIDYGAARQVITDHMVDWKGVKDDQGEELLFSQQQLQDKLDDLDWFIACLESFIDLMNGGGRVKNSRGSGGRGPGR